MTTQESAARCMEYIRGIYDNPLGSFELKTEHTEEGEYVIHNGGTYIAEEMVRWTVDPHDFGSIKVSGQPEILAHVAPLLQAQQFAYSAADDGTLFVIFP